MQLETNRNSFFDDDDMNITFDFQKFNKKKFKNYNGNVEPIIVSNLQYKLLECETFKPSNYGIIGRSLIRYKGGSRKDIDDSIDISNARLNKLKPQNGEFKHGFSLRKNSIQHEFYSNDEMVINNWYDTLRKWCVLVDFHDKYKAIKMIGRGSFAKVYLVEDKQTGESFAVKVFSKESLLLTNKSNAKPSIINEIDIMRAICHENIIKFYDVYESERSIYLVLELIQGKSLQELLKRTNFYEEYDEMIISNIIHLILQALAYLDSKKIMHRDLKPDNILIDKDNKIKIVDFGLAAFINQEPYIFKKCGTPGYIAPEIFNYDVNNPSTYYDSRCDVFAVGCMLYYMLFGKPFFEAYNSSEILKLNRKFTKEYDSYIDIVDELNNSHSKFNKDGIKLLMKLLELNFKKRITSKKALNDKYFASVFKNANKKPDKLENLRLIINPRNYMTLSDNLANRKVMEWKNMEKSNSGAKNHDKYAAVDSLYLDLGPPILNGKTNTLTHGIGSTNNSILLSQSGSGSNTNIGSNASSLASKLNGKPNNGSSFLKAAIIRNMQKNNENIEECKDEMIPRVQQEYKIAEKNPFSKFTELLLTQHSNASFSKDSDSPKHLEFCEDILDENSEVQLHLEKFNKIIPIKHPSKMSTSIIQLKREQKYSSFDLCF